MSSDSNFQLLKAALFTPTSDGGFGLPCLWYGSPGVGKSAVLRSIEQTFNLPVHILSISEVGEAGLGVIPVPTDRGTINYPPPDWVEKVKNGGVVFIDELLCAETSLQKPLLGLIQSKMIGYYHLGKNVRIVAATNDVNQAVGGTDLSAPVANRLCHLNWSTPSVTEWSAWLVSNCTHTGTKIDATVEEERVMREWPRHWSKACGMIIGFLRNRSSLFNKIPEADNPQLSKGWPSPRSFEGAARALASSYVHGLSDMLTEQFVEGYIGPGASKEFFAWVDKEDLPDPQLLVNGEIEFKPSKERLDKAFAVYNSCVMYLLSLKDMNAEQIANTWNVLATALTINAPDLVAEPGKVLATRGLSSFNGDKDVSKAASKVLKKLGIMY